MGRINEGRLIEALWVQELYRKRKLFGVGWMEEGPYIIEELHDDTKMTFNLAWPIA